MLNSHYMVRRLWSDAIRCWSVIHVLIHHIVGSLSLCNIHILLPVVVGSPVLLGETLLKDVNQHMYALITISFNNINYVGCKIERLNHFIHSRIFKFHHWTTKKTVRYGFFHSVCAVVAMDPNSALCLSTLYVEFSAEDEAVFHTCTPKLVLYKSTAHRTCTCRCNQEYIPYFSLFSSWKYFHTVLAVQKFVTWKFLHH